MGRAEVKLDSRGVRALLNDPGVRAEVGKHADRVLAAAKSSAPVESGRYKESIHRVSVTTDRAVERVVADAPHAHLVEARTGNLARALNAAGGA